jgi:hypothetical protein
MKSIWLASFVLCMVGCTSLADRQHADELSSNRLDQDYCTNHGLRYPDLRYIQCRRQLVDSRLYRQWKNSQLLKQSTQPRAGTPPMEGPEPQFRTPDPAHFHCRLEPQFGNDYVFCDYDDLDTGGSAD